MITLKDNRIIGIATKNQGKFSSFREWLDEIDLKVVFLSDLAAVEENDSAKENAIQKAVNASNQVDIPVLASDESMTLFFLKNENQPNAKMKRTVNDNPTDKEMLEYYLMILEKQENKTCIGIIETYNVIAYKGEECGIFHEKDEHFFKYPGSKILKSGRPLASLDYYPQYKKYYTELNDEEKTDMHKHTRKLLSNFVDRTLNKIYK